MKTNQQTARLNQLVVSALAVCLPLLSTGCDTVRDSSMTGRLWDEGVNRCLPAPKPNAKLYWIADHQDVLVTYDELREKNDAIRRRAFFFKPNVRRLEDRTKPRFVEPAKIVESSLVQVPEVGSTNASPQETILVKLSDDGKEFTLLWSGTDLGPYALPVYLDRGSETKRRLLTPLTAAGDFIVVIVVVAVVAGALLSYSYAGSGGH